ncbi:MAG: electron transfer flavoprotein subunit alpha/FixB family protein [Saprospiraceae bacterium]|nr:electron transfer flavoprotein subunit alpha/FixB family protein [Saprospiraceae bacterium]
MVLVYAEHQDGRFKKAAFEATTFARKSAEALGSGVTAVVFGDVEEAGALGESGADKVLKVDVGSIAEADNAMACDILHQIAEKVNARLVVLNHSSFGKSVAGRLAVKSNSGLVSGVVEPVSSGNNGYIAKKSVFSGKAYATYEIESDMGIVTLMRNAIPVDRSGSAVEVENVDVDVPDSRLEIISSDVKKGEVPLPEAELVVSAGRGMKDPSNWDIIEELADALGAATACSRPVADADWRPHHEHVGQTGVAIRPNLYIAIGISGAIQHLAGVNNSKVIVVINKDPEAPFFKAADYGVCADLFDVVPRLTEAVKKFKS